MADPNKEKKLLARYLELMHSPYNDRKHQIIEREIPRELTAYDDKGEVRKVRELLQSTDIVGTTLVPAQVLSTVIAGASPAVCMREIAPIFTATGSSLVVPKGDTRGYAPEVAEGAEYPDKVTAYGTATYTIKDWGEAPGITNNMIDDGLWDVIAFEVANTGARLENTLNQQCLGTLLVNSGDEIDTSATDVGLKAIAKAQAEMMGNGFMPDRIIMHPAAMAYVMGEFTPAGGYYAVGDQTISGQLPANILGMKVGVCGVTHTTTYTWGYGTDSYIGMLLLDSRASGGIAMRQDMSVAEFDDPVKDLKRFRVKMRFGTQYHHAYAAERIEY